MSRVRAVSFDLWDTVFIDDSDEPKRRRQGLPPKRVERRDLVYRFLSRHGAIDRALVDSAYDTADSAFQQVWRHQHVTWAVEVRLQVLLAGLKRVLPRSRGSNPLRRQAGNARSQPEPQGPALAAQHR